MIHTKQTKGAAKRHTERETGRERLRERERGIIITILSRIITVMIA